MCLGAQQLQPGTTLLPQGLCTSLFSGIFLSCSSPVSTPRQGLL